MKRKLVTRGFDALSASDASKMDRILFKLTTSLQKKDAFTFKEMIYSLRGIAFYDADEGQLFKYERKELNPMFVNLAESGSFESAFFEKVLRILESDFYIQYNNTELRKALPAELSNFQYINVTNDFDDLQLCIGFESWNKILYISYFALLYK